MAESSVQNDDKSNLNKQNSTAKEENKLDLSKLDRSWMIRPCEFYNSEYTECASIQARLHQLYVVGETLDCRHWKASYRDCLNWEEKNDTEAAKRVILFEEEQKYARLKAHFKNDVWEHRTEPPANWNKPLPKWMEEYNNESYLNIKQKQILENPNRLEIDRNKWCRVM